MKLCLLLIFSGWNGKLGKQLLLIFSGGMYRRWKAGTKLQIIPNEWVQQMQIHPSAKQIKASKGTYHLRSLWRCINKWQLIIINAKSLKTQGSYQLQSIWELVSIKRSLWKLILIYVKSLSDFFFSSSWGFHFTFMANFLQTTSPPIQSSVN